MKRMILAAIAAALCLSACDAISDAEAISFIESEGYTITQELGSGFLCEEGNKGNDTTGPAYAVSRNGTDSNIIVCPHYEWVKSWPDSDPAHLGNFDRTLTYRGMKLIQWEAKP